MLAEKTTRQSYAVSVLKFQEDSRDWNSIPDHQMYAANTDGDYIETTDNAQGGIPVEWAFHSNLDNDELNIEIYRHYGEYFTNLGDILESEL